MKHVPEISFSATPRGCFVKIGDAEGLIVNQGLFAIFKTLQAEIDALRESIESGGKNEREIKAPRKAARRVSRK